MLDIDMRTKGFSPKQERKIRQAGAILKKVVNSQAFKDRVTSFHWYKRGKRQEGFNRCSLTAGEVYVAFMSGVDRYNKEADNDIDISITLIAGNKYSNTIGFTYPNTFKTWLYLKFLNLWWNTSQKLSGNLGHEYSHNVEGISFHPSKWNPWRKFCAPYGIGNIIAELGEQYATEDDVLSPVVSNKVQVCRPTYSWFPWFFKSCKWIDTEMVV